MRRMLTAIQETMNDYQPVTDEAPQETEIAILRSQRDHCGGLLRTNLEPLATLQRQYMMHGRFIAVRFVIGVIDKLTEEVWNCRMRPTCRTEDGTKFLDINNGRYMIESTVEPANGITGISSTDWKGDSLPLYLAEIDFLLPADVSMQYHVTLKLFSLAGANRRELTSAFQTITTFPEGSCLDDIQEGSGLEHVEHPLQKTKPKGILARAEGWHIIMHLQKLVDDGQRERFRGDKEIMFLFVKHHPALSDLLPCVLQEENFLYQDEELVELSKNAVKIATNHHSPNAIFFHFRTKCTEAIRWAKEGNYIEARKHLEQASELCNEMAAGQFKAILCYEWAQYYTEKAASQGDLNEQEKEDAERYFDGVVQYLNCDELMTDVGNNRLLLQCLIRRLSFYLKTSRRDVPNFYLKVSASELSNAGGVLGKIRENFPEPHSISKKHQTLILMFETDLHIRNQNYGDAFESCTKGLLLARDLNRDSWTLGMKGRLCHVLQQTGMERGNIKQWTPRVDDNPIGAGSDTHNQNLLTIDQLLEKIAD